MLVKRSFQEVMHDRGRDKWMDFDPKLLFLWVVISQKYYSMSGKRGGDIAEN
jgi:hypothetical protein